jgi:hypothetical protein
MYIFSICNSIFVAVVSRDIWRWVWINREVPSLPLQLARTILVNEGLVVWFHLLNVRQGISFRVQVELTENN